MKYYLNSILVVEGKEDVSYLSSFIDAEFVMTNGYDIPQSEIDYLNAASSFKRIIVLVDPDEAGRNIEKKLAAKIKKAIYLNVEISKCNRGKKQGIAECEQEEIIKLLKPYFEDKIEEKTRKTQINSLKIDLSDKGFRQFLSQKHSLGKCNNKTIIRRLETLQITKQEIKETMKEYKNGN